MPILINHLTRMQPGAICTAGIDLASGRHIRPVMGTLLARDLLASEGGPLELGRVLDLGETVFCGRMPEIEDRLFKPESVQLIDTWPPDQLREHCRSLATTRLAEIFGPALEPIQYGPHDCPTAAVPERSGLRSLGCYLAHQPALKTFDTARGPRIRLEFTESDIRYSVAVTDLHLWQADHATPDRAAEQRVQHQLATLSGPAVLAIGLSRPYRARPEDPPRHWLQVNNILV